MSLTQEEVNELYNQAVVKAEEMCNYYNGTHRGREGFRNALYARLRYHYINRYGNSRMRYANRWYQHSPLARVFKKNSLFAFGTHMSKETAMLNKVLDQVTNEYFTDEDKAMFDIQAMVKNMGSCVRDIEGINKEGENVSKELAKIPKFLETGIWE